MSITFSIIKLLSRLEYHMKWPASKCLSSALLAVWENRPVNVDLWHYIHESTMHSITSTRVLLDWTDIFDTQMLCSSEHYKSMGNQRWPVSLKLPFWPLLMVQQICSRLDTVIHKLNFWLQVPFPTCSAVLYHTVFPVVCLYIFIHGDICIFHPSLIVLP